MIRITGLHPQGLLQEKLTLSHLYTDLQKLNIELGIFDTNHQHKVN